MVTDNRKQREERKTYAEALNEDFRNGIKETREGVVSEKERNTGICDNFPYVSKVMDCNEEDSSEFGKPKPNFSDICKDLLFPKQINSSEMFSTPPVVIQTHLFLIMLAIAVLEVLVHMQICHWIHMTRRF